MSILSKIQALITAANSKTGETDTTLTDAVQTLVDGYGQGGGDSLSSVISKIDGGSFTLASDTNCQSYDIAHSLGVVPKSFVVWTEDITLGEAQSAIFLVRIDYFDTSYSATTVSTNMTTRIATGGAAVTGGAGITAAAVSSWVTASKICTYFNTNYKAGCLYKWLAWA